MARTKTRKLQAWCDKCGAVQLFKTREGKVAPWHRRRRIHLKLTDWVDQAGHIVAN